MSKRPHGEDVDQWGVFLSDRSTMVASDNVIKRRNTEAHELKAEVLTQVARTAAMDLILHNLKRECKTAMVKATENGRRQAKFSVQSPSMVIGQMTYRLTVSDKDDLVQALIDFFTLAGKGVEVEGLKVVDAQSDFREITFAW